MKLSQIAALLLLFLSLSTAYAADRGVFKNKSHKQHTLTKWEAKKIKTEFKNRFNSTGATGQKLNANPWEAKRARQHKKSQQALRLSNTWGGCREYAYKQRGQCYAGGGDAYTCERYYDARVGHCNVTFN
ncbi:hypothetical protein MNBD_GAMMA09-2319 [hydrothermal vent metagenome]|uniref:Uncharacterized protein n=1 Tax=hydrothermal vent metagenome TaxID=652676 RepID=A0A3B0YLG7_9ZZZZ